MPQKHLHTPPPETCTYVTGPLNPQLFRPLEIQTILGIRYHNHNRPIVLKPNYLFAQHIQSPQMSAILDTKN